MGNLLALKWAMLSAIGPGIRDFLKKQEWLWIYDGWF